MAQVQAVAESEVDRRYLEPARHREGWALSNGEVVGRLVWNDQAGDGQPYRVIIDGRTLSWQELGRTLEAYGAGGSASSSETRSRTSAAMRISSSCPSATTGTGQQVGKQRRPLEARVVAAAEAAPAEQSYVSPIDVLIGVGWLTPQAVDGWRQGRVEDLEQLAQADLDKLSAATAILDRWAAGEGLLPSQTAYIARTRDRRQLRFSRSGDADIEEAYRKHWVSAEASEAKRRRIEEKQKAVPDLVVVAALNDWTCTACSGTGELLIMESPGPVCLLCADLDHLVLLPAGDAALTRRAKKASALSAVVVRFSRSRRRYERVGILVEEAALNRAEQECLADEEARSRRRQREEERRGEQDLEFQAELAAEIRRLFPGCPPGRDEAIAQHAGARRSGRIGRSAAGRAIDPVAISLAVVASVRHVDTPYDALLMSGVARADARAQVADQIETVLESWRVAIVR